MSLREIIGVVAGIVSLVSFAPYIISIFQKKTRPHRATYAIWTVVGIVTIAGYIGSGARTTIYIGLVYATFSFLIFLLSLKFGVGGLTSLDILCLIGAAIGIGLWVITKNPQTALFSGIIVEIFGQIPTWKKSYLQPATEDTFAWLLDSIGSALNLIAITS